MALEIEHRYLLCTPVDTIRNMAIRYANIEQVYLEGTGEWTMRLRRTSADCISHIMTMKRALAHAISTEIEHEIQEATYRSYLDSGFAKRGLLKTRYYVPHEDRLWEVDVFEGKLAGMVIAELELGDVHDRSYSNPFDGKEITGEKKYSNASLAHEDWS